MRSRKFIISSAVYTTKIQVERRRFFPDPNRPLVLPTRTQTKVTYRRTYVVLNVDVLERLHYKHGRHFSRMGGRGLSVPLSFRMTEHHPTNDHPSAFGDEGPRMTGISKFGVAFAPPIPISRDVSDPCGRFMDRWMQLLRHLVSRRHCSSLI